MVPTRFYEFVNSFGATAAGWCSAALLLNDLSVAQNSCMYEISAIIEGPDCGILGQGSAVATSISPNGEWVCGFFTCPGGNDVGFLYAVQTAAVTIIPFPQGFIYMMPQDVNDNAIVVGGGHNNIVGDRAFVYDGNTGQITQLPAQNPNYGWSAANAINNAGEVCGRRSIDDGGDPTVPVTAFRWSAEDGFTDFGLLNGNHTYASDISESGMMTVLTLGLDAALWDGTKSVSLGMPPVKGADWVVPHAIGLNDKIVGTIAIFTESLSVPFSFANGSFELLPTLANPRFPSSVPVAINDEGVIVGASRNSETVIDWRATIWDSDIARDLNDFVDDTRDITLEVAAAISNDRMIVCTGVRDGDVLSVLLVPSIIPMAGDADGNCRVDVDDLLLVINEWGQTDSRADLNHDGLVDLSDIVFVLFYWTSD